MSTSAEARAVLAGWTACGSAGDGWQLRTITAADVKGRVGPGGVDGLLVTFERPVG
jgi:hypothetical protein